MRNQFVSGNSCSRTLDTSTQRWKCAFHGHTRHPLRPPRVMPTRQQTRQSPARSWWFPDRTPQRSPSASVSMDEPAEGSRLLLQEEGGGGDQEPLLLLPQVRPPVSFLSSFVCEVQIPVYPSKSAGFAPDLASHFPSLFVESKYLHKESIIRVKSQTQIETAREGNLWFHHVYYSSPQVDATCRLLNSEFKQVMWKLWPHTNKCEVQLLILDTFAFVHVGKIDVVAGCPAFPFLICLVLVMQFSAFF